MNKLMHVLHVNSGNLYGGIETLLTTLADLRSLCPAMEPGFANCFDDRSSEELRQTGAPVYRLGPVRVSRPWTILRARRALASLLVEQRYDVAVCHGSWNHALFGPVIRRHAVPLVFWAHGPASKSHWLDRWASWTRPDLVLANSRWTREHLTLFPGVPTEVCYLPVVDRSGDRQFDRQSVRKELGTSLETVVIVQASRLEAWKGHALLLDALGGLREVPGWECWIAGGAQRVEEERYAAKLRCQAEACGIAARVRFLGQRRDVPRVLAAADIHCQPNRDPEPFGIAFVEALFAGLPVVTTAQGGVLEIVNDTCSLLAPVGDAFSLEQLLRKLIDDPLLRLRLSHAGPSRARAICNPASTLDQLNSLLQSVAARKDIGSRTKKNTFIDIHKKISCP